MSKPLFDDAAGHYNYCPAVLHHEGVTHLWYCANEKAYEIVDSIMYRHEKKHFSSPEVALRPDDDITAWDGVHVCDPSVIKGIFNDGETVYHYAMAYLGCNTLDCTNNEIGLAFAKTPAGPWIKWSQNPLVTFDLKGFKRYWGVGQPSLINLNRQSKLGLFYTRGDGLGSHQWFLMFDAKNIYQMKEMTHHPISHKGLWRLDGLPDALINVDAAFDPVCDVLWVVRDKCGDDGLYPSIIRQAVEVSWIPFSDLKRGTWQKEAVIDHALTHFVRNHNAALKRDAYGHLLDRHDAMDVYYTTSIHAKSNEDLQYLWRYRIHRHRIRLK